MTKKRWLLGGALFLLVCGIWESLVGERPETERLPFIELDLSVVPGMKCSVELLYEGQGEPSKWQLQQQSDAIAAEHPGYARHFVGFYLDGMPVGDGYFATAHRTDGQLDNVVVIGK